ncbi:MAG: SUMF1/EgtB/PvdO family nonheme iron enzyme [Candidatus Tectomicrobia bacterium]|uniref:SUMF1/EgtB/PvdO family nonheme iron enzyme n=1 Tax=Tectimicrobiota bacterium TaxID=2528274 RepID=A0A932FXB9_UNCTE|nr:SUMF1/EgtB/PvdO family nonheme iron enzyme [Candidatus Tectomicrobia bacterium]
MRAKAMHLQRKGCILGLLLSFSLFFFSTTGWGAEGQRPGPGKSARENAEMVLIPEGAFLRGSGEREAQIISHIMGVPTNFRDKEPQTVTRLKGFYIDTHEVTNAQYTEFLQATGDHPPDHWTEGAYPPGKGDYPVIYISWISAQRYCEWAGKRLPTEEEWEKAARGSDGRLFPWGDRFEPGKANLWEEGIKAPRSVGQYRQDRSPYGVYDMAGNVMEWTATLFQDDLTIVRGGSWANDQAESRLDRKMISELDVTSNGVGFRCARSEERPLKTYVRQPDGSLKLLGKDSG